MTVLGEYSEVAIANLALQEIGRGMMLTSLDEPNTAARNIKLRYPYARDAVLRGFPWNFASARAALPALADVPPFEFAHQYELPEDCLFVRWLEGGDTNDWRVETVTIGGAPKRVILTNLGAPLNIKYTTRVTSPKQFDPLFVAALAARIAADVAVSLSESVSKAQGLWQIYTSKLREAWKNDSQEGTADEFPAGSWTQARFGGQVRPYSDWDPNF